METETNTGSTTTTASKLRQISSPGSCVALQICLRTVAAATTLAAACLIFNSTQSRVLYGTATDARYTYSPAFKFFVFVNAVACASSALSLLMVFIVGQRFSNSVKYFFLFLHDLMLTTLLVAGCGAATSVAYLGKNGNSHAGWMPICDYFEIFCHKVTVALMLSYLSTFSYFILTIISIDKSRHISL